MRTFFLYSFFSPTLFPAKNYLFYAVADSKKNIKRAGTLLIPSTYEKERAKKDDEDEENKQEKKDLDEFVQDATKNIFHLKSFFPFDFFPDELVIDSGKVTIVKNYFYFSKQMRNISLDDIGDVMIETGPFFATLVILDKSAGNVIKEDLKIHFVDKSKAFEARKLIQGLIICRKEKVDLSGHTDGEIREKVEQIGSTVEE
jgi:hypothetical protein